jgi:hypothetical protein
VFVLILGEKGFNPDPNSVDSSPNRRRRDEPEPHRLPDRVRQGDDDGPERGGSTRKGKLEGKSVRSGTRQEHGQEGCLAHRCWVTLICNFIVSL